MRSSHPNLFLTVLMCGVWSITNGGVMLFEPPRMPTLMPAVPVGAAFVLGGVGLVVGALRSIKVARVAGGLVATQCAGLAAGLFAGYGTVTASLDRPIAYLVILIWHLIWIREPPVNPATRRS